MAKFLIACAFASLVRGLRYDPAFVDYNLNQNKDAIDPVDFDGDRGKGFVYKTSPKDWRVPTYTLFLDRFANGDPSNDNANGTIFEQDITSNQLRHGGDLQGLIDSLDYIHGMGIKIIYIAGSPFMNLPWGVDSYSPLDLTLLDKHFGDIKQWQATIDEIHNRGMYVILDHTFSTMGDLLSFKGFENVTAPFELKEHNVAYKSNRRYLDFNVSNNYLEKCDYPRFWDETGTPVNSSVTDQLQGCYDSDFDHYGDIEAFGVHPDWQRSLAKFASVQDRLRDWKPSVRQRLETFSCITIKMLDIDGFRYDKATQITVDALADHNEAVRKCAAGVGKNNFFLPGEITGGNGYGSVYIGRGRQGDQKLGDVAKAMNMTSDNAGNNSFIRDKGKNALDSGAFHYSVYRYLTRFLGLSGNLEAGFDLPLNWVDMWSQMILTNDLINPNTGVFDPRHQLGTTNQDVFRWPAIEQGVDRMLLGMFITTIHMPGAPLVYYGEEQAFYVLDSTAENYLFGRQAMSATPGWMLHGCHATGSTQFVGWPQNNQSRNGCRDEAVSYDHRDPSHPVRNIMKAMYKMRENFPSLQDGWLLQPMSNQTDSVIIDHTGQDMRPTDRGLWGVARAMFPGVQGQFATNAVWLVYHNRAEEREYSFNCLNGDDGFIAPFTAGSTVKNLFYPYDTIDRLDKSPTKPLGFNGSAGANGCTNKIKMKAWDFRAYVDIASWQEPPPMMTKFTPGHDAPIISSDTVDITFEFSRVMDCAAITKAITIESTVEGNAGSPKLGTPKCQVLNNEEVAPFVGSIPSNYRWSATLTNVADGVHRITVTNATDLAGESTGSTDHLLIRVGKPDNPIVWPFAANYSQTLVTKEGKDLFVNHNAAGADMWRYSTNWGSNYSDWQAYDGGKVKIDILPWSGTKKQAWSGDHVIVQYWSKLIGSSAFKQEGDSDPKQKQRRFPHIFAHGLFNKFGFDGGLKNAMTLLDDGKWQMHFMDEWPTNFQLNIWGMNPDGKPDASFVYGDVDSDMVLDRMPPSSLAKNVLNITSKPKLPALSYRVVLDDRTLTFALEPQGNIWIQIIMFILLAVLPVLGGLFAVWIFMGSFYKVKINKVGFKKRGRSPFRSAANRLSSISFEALGHKDDDEIELGAVPGKRRKVIIATIEYNIDDWNIKIKIGGLGVMAQLMGKALEHQDLIWVVPCVGGIDYPIDQRAEPMYAPIMGKEFEIEVQYHQVNNITYVLLDAPIFRQQTKTDPYPPRMDDIDSAIYYSAWNYCIAETIRRFNPDLYHINDYHGAAAPLYLLPRTIPCALSLHNAEFQGMWPMRNPEESKEVCEVFNLDPEIVKEYVQFGSVFNLLHAGASYLRVHQKGFGAVGVSKKYGDRSYARYPIFWGLSKIGQLPNPDPSDTAEWSRDEEVRKEDVVIDQVAESNRGNLRKQAQEWAGLEENPNADLFVFVGRWSLQKGVDLIADIFPSILEKYPQTQLICVGPVIDLYGKFAALKLEKLMEKYPKRVYSKPEFTALPPYIFSGAEFALIPSRDEPFGLVAVEFGRKGALGVGARVGGLGQMPGFWYTIESTASQHLLHQFREAIVSALESKQKTRVKMRAWSAKQRFPVAQWVEDLNILQGECIRIHYKEAKKHKRLTGPHHGTTLTVPSEIDLPGQNRRSFIEDSDVESLAGDRSRASSISVPYIQAPPNEDSLSRRSISNPLGSPGSPPVGTDSAESPFLPPNPMFPSHSARSSVSSFATLMPGGYGNEPGNRASVDTFAMRMMSADPSETRPQAYGLPNPQARPNASQLYAQHNSSRLSVVDVVGGRQDFKLQKVDPFFTDSTGEYHKKFEQKLAGLTAKNSDTELVIDDFLKESEKEWFKEFRDAKLGRSHSPSRTREGAGLIVKKRNRSRESRRTSVASFNSLAPSDDEEDDRQEQRNPDDRDDEFLLGTGYKPPTGVKKLLQIRVGDWPVYSFILSLGQIMAANSFQVVLLAGEAGQTTTQLYIVAGTYAITSLLWWFVFRRLPSVYVLSIPWFFYGLAFVLLSVTPFMSAGPRVAIQSLATAMYATASSSGALFFALNFGDEGGAPIMIWIFRAAVIQGIQQFYVLGLFYWGSLMTSQSPTGVLTGNILNTPIPKIVVIAAPFAILMWIIGAVSFMGLPVYYHQSPDKIPSFYGSLIRRRIVPWFFLTVIVQNFFLSSTYGRNWEFLFYSRVIPSWSVVILAFGFFGILWALSLWLFSHFSETHPWIVPMFAIGLGAPRWAQMLWGVSGIGLYLPWVGTAVASAILTRCLWLWLGLLDTIQGVGLGMVLLLTLTRQHVAATLIGAQVLGAAFTILARAVGPDGEGPGDVFPDFSEGVLPGFSKPWFWIALGLNLLLPIGFFKFFRKDQVAKP